MIGTARTDTEIARAMTRTETMLKQMVAASAVLSVVVLP
jgi:hypothetical protein